ncbi:MAG: Cof-type HAD-IIB family hydrolase [Clostridium perfringens]|nr:Cof-type HAD-IIB family hydrolase [Clostridium perfringens]
MYKLICIDMDGTLLNKDHEVSKENKEALKEALRRGVRIAISTGRVFPTIEIYSKLLGINVDVICSNGSYIKERNSEDIIFKSILNENLLNKIYNMTRKYNFLTYFDTTEGIISETKIPDNDSYRLMNSWVNEEKIKLYQVPDFKEAFNDEKHNILKVILIQTKTSKTFEDAKEDLEEISKIADLAYSWGGAVEIMEKGTTKGNAVKMLADKLNIKKEEIICIGDSGNDLSMLKEAGLSIVMGNASEKIKKYADFVTDTNENSGVAKAIRKFVLND